MYLARLLNSALSVDLNLRYIASTASRDAEAAAAGYWDAISQHMAY